MEKRVWIFAIAVLSCLITITNAAKDLNEISIRGIVEGFYGTPWSHSKRLQMIKFMGKKDLNYYIYAPKDDEYHREKWRIPYPKNKLNELQDLIAEGFVNGVAFSFALSPGLDIHFEGDQGEEDLKSLIAKFEEWYTVGCRDFAIFFDDIETKDGINQAKFLNKVNEQFIKVKNGVKPLFTVPTEYRTANMFDNEGNLNVYTKDFSSLIQEDIFIMYTGPRVVSEGIPIEDITKVEAVFKRKMAIWWNYPVNDYLPEKLALGPITQISGEVAGHISAFLMNPMEHAILSEISLATGADFCINPTTYNEDLSWIKAIKEQYGDISNEMLIFADHNQRMYKNQNVSCGRPDAPKTREIIDQFWEKINAGQDHSQETIFLKKEFVKMQAASNTLLELLNEDIMSELSPQWNRFDLVVDWDLNALHMILYVFNGDTVRALDIYKKLREYIDKSDSAKHPLTSERTADAFIREAVSWYENHP